MVEYNANKHKISTKNPPARINSAVHITTDNSHSRASTHPDPDDGANSTNTLPILAYSEGPA
jgi:hypothetical protein